MDADEVVDTGLTVVPVAEPEASVQALEAIVGFERGRPVGAEGHYADATSLRDALAPVFDPRSISWASPTTTVGSST